MSQLKIELPTIQNWNCHNCSGCCKQHGIFITEEERQRIESQGWEATGELPENIEPIVKVGRKQSRLAQQPDGACVFLDEQGLCRIHGKFGEAAKPLACRIYPYAFHPKGNGVTVSLRFSCPSITQNLGTPLVKQSKEIREIAKLVVPKNRPESVPPKVTGQTQLDWNETLEIVDRLDKSMADAAIPITLKLLRTLFWLDLIQQTNYKNIRGKRLAELLDLLIGTAPAEVPSIPETVSPANVALIQFRLLAGQYARKDTFASMDTSLRGRFAQLKAASRLSSGKGKLPQLRPDLGEVPCSALEGSFGSIPDESEELLTRYFRVKIQGLHFCGPAFYDIAVIEGFQALALTYPVILWLARWRAVTQSRTTITAEDIREALQIVDHQHGYSQVFGTWSSKKRVTTITQSGNLEKLLTWYAR